MQNLKPHNPLSNENGITIVLVAILMVVLVMFVALAVDLGHLEIRGDGLGDALQQPDGLQDAHEVAQGRVRHDPSRFAAEARPGGLAREAARV